MNSSVFLIMLIAGLILAAGGAAVYLDNARSLQEDRAELSTAQPRLVAVDVYNVTNQSARYIRIQVTSNEPVRINDTLIQLRTDEEVAHLRYREGLLVRDEAEGFYTQ